MLLRYKPATENRKRRGPIEKLRELVRKHQAGEKPIEPGRFKNRKEVALGDRVFLLLQGMARRLLDTAKLLAKGDS